MAASTLLLSYTVIASYPKDFPPQESIQEKAFDKLVFLFSCLTCRNGQQMLPDYAA